jgi:plastocyanin
LEAKGTIYASLMATNSTATNMAQLKISASASVMGKPVSREVNGFGKISVGSKASLYVAMEPYDETRTNFSDHVIAEKPAEITLSPGQTIPAWLKVRRNGHDDLVTFTVEGLPHGVIVDNIGLNGVLIPKNEDHRQIFLTAASWVPEIDRLCFAEAKQGEIPTSFPVMIHIKKRAELRASSKN